MKVTTILAAGILIIGVVAAGVWKFAGPALEQRVKVQTSDAARSKGTVQIGVDNFIGYWQLCSSYQKTLMRNEGYDLKCVDDEAAYEERFKKLKKGEIQFAVATIDSYELNALSSQYPGLMVTVIDRSNGADGAVACTDRVKNIDGLKRGGLKVAFAPGTPSEHLIKVVATHFDIPEWRAVDKSWRIETKSSAEAAKKCLAGEADVAVMWEPDITKTLKRNPKASKLLGTDFSPNTIIDVLIVRREFARDNPGVVSLLLKNYFKTLYHYKQNPDTAIAHALEYVNAAATAETRLTVDDAKSAMKGVAWVNLAENATLWFGVAEPEPGTPAKFGLIDSIESTTRILTDSGDFTASRRPPDDVRLMVASNFVKELYETGLASGEKVDTKGADSLSREFSELTEVQWAALKEIGTLRVRPVNFPSGTDVMSVEARENVDRIAEAIKSYPQARIVIEGHTSTRGDPNENLALSQDRAEAVARYLQVTFQVSPSRIRAVGFGGKKPLVQNAGESNREFLGRLPRVVVKLVTENY